MVKSKTQLVIGVCLLLTLGSAVAVSAESVFSDTVGHWAENNIRELQTKQVLNGYPDGTFKPDQAITRAEFAKMVAQTFKYNDENAKCTFSDVPQQHWARPYIGQVAAKKIMNSFGDGAFHSERVLNRAQSITMLMRILEPIKDEESYDSWKTSFRDIDEKHWAYQAVSLSEYFGILPPNYKDTLTPNMTVTRAEATYMLNKLSQITVNRGKITSIDDYSGVVNFVDDKNATKLTMILPQTIILRNNTVAARETLQVGDDITTINDVSGNARILKTYGEVTKNDLLSKISRMSKGKLSVSQVNSIISGDWEALKSDLQGELYNSLVNLGLTAAEAESIMVQDWNYLDTLSKMRLAEGMSDYLGVTRDFAEALLERDKNKILEYGKIELTTMALEKLIGRL